MQNSIKYLMALAALCLHLGLHAQSGSLGDGYASISISPATSVEEEQGQSEIRLVQLLPESGELVIHAPHASRVVLWSVAGKRLGEWSLGQGENRLAVGSLAAGTYFLRSEEGREALAFTWRRR